MLGNNETRRTILKKTVTVAASAAGVAGGTEFLTDSNDGLSPQDTKDHYIQFRIGEGVREKTYTVSVPDRDPDFENVESGGDDVYTGENSTVIDGSLRPDGADYDEISFDGSLNSSDFEYDTDPGVQVIIG